MELEHNVDIVHISRHGSGWTATINIGIDSDQSTTHHVSVDDDYFEHLTRGRVDVETLLKETFLFLLERETNESILKNFDLDVIGTYFDDFESEIDKRLQKY